MFHILTIVPLLIEVSGDFENSLQSFSITIVRAFDASLVPNETLCLQTSIKLIE